MLLFINVLKTTKHSFNKTSTNFQIIKLLGDVKLERDVIMYRAYLAQKNYSVVVSEVKTSSPPQLLDLRRLAAYLSNRDRKKEYVMLFEVN